MIQLLRPRDDERRCAAERLLKRAVFSETSADFRRAAEGGGRGRPVGRDLERPYGQSVRARDRGHQPEDNRGAGQGGSRGRRKFVFASSCSVYGFAQGAPRRETDPLNPLTAYARSKIGAEQQLQAIDTDMILTSLRFATACGMSDRLRLDLVLNDFVAALWRPENHRTFRWHALETSDRRRGHGPRHRLGRRP